MPFRDFVVHHYNSAFSNPGSKNGIHGRGWKLSYETELYKVGNTLQIILADGAHLIFSRDFSDPSLCARLDPSHGKGRIRKTAQGEEYARH